MVDQYISALLSLDPSPTTLAMLGVCLDFCTSQKDKATIDKHKVSCLHHIMDCRFSGLLYLPLNKSRLTTLQAAMLDLYIKSVLMSKTKTHQHILDKSGSLLRHVSHSEFKELLLPSIQKTMLRSPENAMQGELLFGLSWL